MKTYDAERKELFSKLNRTLAEIDARWKEAHLKGGSYAGGQDSKEDKERHAAIVEYNQKLRELKVKYGR